MKYRNHKIFPTTIFEVDVSDEIGKEDQFFMIEYIDKMIENGEYCTSEYRSTPLYQTYSSLFNSDCSEVWSKLRETFLNACGLYLENVENFIPLQEETIIIDCNAWGYKSWKSLNKTQCNPWHTHSPSIISGVFYLKIPKCDNGYLSGTEMSDVRYPECASTRNYVPMCREFTWSIFPGWLPHRSLRSDTEDPRYVVAANAYGSVIH